MRFILRLIFLVLCCTATSDCPLAQATSVSAQPVKVVKVIDGDTFDVEYQDTVFRVRLFGIDAPERGQEFFEESRNLLNGLTMNKQVVLETKGKDAYGRTLAIIYRCSDHLNVNYHMVAMGLAWHYVYYSSDMELAKLESSARRKQLGIWSVYNFLEPWKYRRN